MALALFYILIQVSERAHVVKVCEPEYLVQLFAGDGEYSFFFIISGYDFSVIKGPFPPYQNRSKGLYLLPLADSAPLCGVL